MTGYQYQRYLIDSGYYDPDPEEEEAQYEADWMARLEANALEALDALETSAHDL